MLRTIVIGLFAALAFAPGALAAAPVLVTVTQAAGKTSATWTLPTGGQAWTIEVAKASAVDSDGYFIAANVVDTEVFIDTRTSWSSDEVLEPGTYYVHLSGWDRNCSSCPIPEWSAVRTLTVTATSSGTTPSSPATTSGGTGSTTPASSTTGPASPPTPTSTSTPAATSQPSSPATTSAPVASSTPVVSNGVGTVSSVVAKQKGGLATIAFRVCGSGTVDVKVLALRGSRSHPAVVTLPLTGGCTGYSLRLGLPSGAGRASVSVGGVVAAL